ncbi:hypothetical protein K2173_002604 [Erythroxylum novogranatense]|uniref:BTB/POZ domain-containing protein n=1 Tax=Erythroxylum novogranatense TaxID=1862640 RepID=A0AAV8TT24_9ROSI|nr:hypothetical protein K2173_002604 [Erythroxylum novogranatense]
MSSRWNDRLGVVDTIYEEEYEYSSSLSPSSPPTPLHSRVQSWSLATGKKTDVRIYVQGTCFHLHKEPLISRSCYLKRQLTELSQITLPLNITADTFFLIADYCYGNHVVITPFNVAALRTAADLLEMTQSKGKRDDNLKQLTETYFRRVITANRELTLITFRYCLRLLPESEATAFLVSRCLEALDLSDESEDLDACLVQVIALPAEEFQIIAESMQCRFISHDMLYKIIDLYIKEHSGEITEDQRVEICNLINCDKLSQPLLMHAVQNPRLPLRFVVRAMLIEQLNTRRAIIKTATNTNHDKHGNHHHHDNVVLGGGSSVTLGSLLRWDAATIEATQLKAEMEATNSRIESLEKELAGMKKQLEKSEKQRCLMEKLLLESEKEIKAREKGRFELEEREERSVMGSSRSASFHYGPREVKVERGQTGSASFATAFRFGFKGEGVTEKSVSSRPSCVNSATSNGKGWISRLKNTFGISKSSSKCRADRRSSGKYKNGTRSVDEVFASSPCDQTGIHYLG